MGTDIHISIEQKLPNEDRWVGALVDETVPRDSYLFNAINADVRPGRFEGESIKEGVMPVPADLSMEVKKALEKWRGDNFTVLTEAEFVQYFPWNWETLSHDRFGHFASLCHAYIRMWPFYDHRIILWFDC